METKKFGDKKIIIRTLVKGDIKRAKDFQDYVNSLVREEAKILINKNLTIKEEKEFLEGAVKAAKKKSAVQIVAECDGKIVGMSSVKMDRYRRNHVGTLGLSIRNGYRGMGLGEQVIRSVIDLAKKELKPNLKIIMLTVYQDNKPALGLYKKVGFKKVASLPNVIQSGKKLVGENIMFLYV